MIHGIKSWHCSRVFTRTSILTCLQAVKPVGLHDDGNPAAPIRLMAIVITNLMQAIWFAANFSLYSGCTTSSRRLSSSSSYCRLSLIDPARASTSRRAANNIRWTPEACDTRERSFTPADALRCGMLRYVAKNDATCHTTPHRNAPHSMWTNLKAVNF